MSLNRFGASRSPRRAPAPMAGLWLSKACEVRVLACDAGGLSYRPARAVWKVISWERTLRARVEVRERVRVKVRVRVRRIHAKLRYVTASASHAVAQTIREKILKSTAAPGFGQVYLRKSTHIPPTFWPRLTSCHSLLGFFSTRIGERCPRALHCTARRLLGTSRLRSPRRRNFCWSPSLPLWL